MIIDNIQSEDNKDTLEDKTSTHNIQKRRNIEIEAKSEDDDSNKPNNDDHIAIDEKLEEIDKEKLAKMDRLRAKAIEELIATESTYVDGLSKLIKYFIEPLKNSEDKKVRKLITLNDHQLIFPSDLATIYAFHVEFNSALINATKEWNNQTSKIGDLFVEYGELFKLYQDYMVKYDSCIQHLNKLLHKNSKFNKWSLEQSKKVNGLTIESLLILPIQRLPRYELLLQEIIKYTEKYHVDLYSLKNAYDQVCEVTELINDKMNEYDQRLKATSINKRFNDKDKVRMSKKFIDNPSRIFIKESTIQTDIIKHDKFGNRSHLILFLFNDCIIYGYKTSNKLLSFGDVIQFDNLFDVELVEYNQHNQNYQNRYCLKIVCTTNSIWISFKDDKLRSKWMDIILEQSSSFNEKTQNRQNIINYRRTSLKSEISQTNDDENENEIYLPYPAFVPFDFEDICIDCDKAFSTFKRKKHHCNYCGKLCCNKCLNQTCVNIWKLNIEGKEELVKVCMNCKMERDTYLNTAKGLEILDEEKEENNLSIKKHPTDDNISQSTFDLTMDHMRTSQRYQKRRNTMHDQKQKRREINTEDNDEERNGYQD